MTADSTRHELARPFIVVATRRPIGYEGTYPLPEGELMVVRDVVEAVPAP